MNGRRRAPTALQAWLLALLLLAAQAAGLAHHVAHAAGLAPAAWGADHEAGGATCKLVDQLAHAEALCSAPLLPAVPQPAPEPVAEAPRPRLPAAEPAPYRARAPPRRHA